ncbi:hypothetical protein BN59_00479 [Legionella massiliensis]|uniref:Uncharacterized protein n=1 Tax=Legionella massiliensis TaxID=1034943 RepID=A0A078KTC6_9GAMM|nr:hypothetical protein [Legionella massiliensis]CDZ76212.1 hypothetical protein BN59_00479 [Legionella massiliensis]CEE11950.1 hypothetical protein BN1094_00479 [Legionella massiliensis]
MNYFGTEIFWTALLSQVFTLFLSTIIGRLWAVALPYKMQAPARFYLSPVFGLATLTIFACFVGRFLPLGNTPVVPVGISALFIWALYREQNRYSALQHAVVVSLVGVICGTSILCILYKYGGFNPHNDAYFYLTHANWLQSNAFAKTIPPEQVIPYDSAVANFQSLGLRMGGSFLMALIQALLRIQWSYDVYPSVVGSSITVCCLAMGFPIATALRPMRRFYRFALLSLPALSLGGLVLSANSGFMSQCVGLAVGGGLLFLVGPLLAWISKENPKGRTIVRASLPAILLLVGLIYTYPEPAPFLCLALGLSSLIMAYRFKAWKKLFLFNIVLFGVSFLIVNSEILRVITALGFESGAVVGSPVDWTLLGYIGHMFGVHGGVWSDPFQWTLPMTIRLHFYLGASLFALLLLFLAVRANYIKLEILKGTLLPAAVVCVVFLLAVLIYRYFVASPFPVGKGQSWSQFKLTDWAHPFAMVLVIAAIASTRRYLGKLNDYGILSLVILCFLTTIHMSKLRFLQIHYMYPKTRNIEQVYLDLRKTVLAQCPADLPVYLNFPMGNLKYRQMVVYYLYDRKVASDWSDDPYIYQFLPRQNYVQEPALGACVVELKHNRMVEQGVLIDPFHIGKLERLGYFQIISVTDSYGRESDGENEWYWVKNKINIELNPLLFAKDQLKTKISFEYQTRGEQQLTLHLITDDNKTEDIIINQGNTSREASFEGVIDIPPASLRQVIIETDGKATPLSAKDSREAAWMLKNFKIGGSN